MSKALPTIQYQGHSYFIDLRLHELRNTDRPYLSINFDDVKDDTLIERISSVWAQDLLQFKDS